MHNLDGSQWNWLWIENYLLLCCPMSQCTVPSLSIDCLLNKKEQKKKRTLKKNLVSAIVLWMMYAAVLFFIFYIALWCRETHLNNSCCKAVLSQTLLSYCGEREKKKKMEAHLTWGLYHSKSTVQFYNDSLLDSIALTFSPIIHPLKLGFWIKRLLESCSSFNHLVSAGL